MLHPPLVASLVVFITMFKSNPSNEFEQRPLHTNLSACYLILLVVYCCLLPKARKLAKCPLPKRLQMGNEIICPRHSCLLVGWPHTIDRLPLSKTLQPKAGNDTNDPLYERLQKCPFVSFSTERWREPTLIHPSTCFLPPFPSLVLLFFFSSQTSAPEKKVFYGCLYVCVLFCQSKPLSITAAS